MGYKLVITEAAEFQLDNLISYLLLDLQNESAAMNLLNHIESLYRRIEENPYQFPVYDNPYLHENKYREAVLTDMNYIVIFRVGIECVYIVGVFHQLENYHTYLFLH